MSRLIVKNLPKYITQERFKEHFEQKGVVTDCKLCKTKEGVFRRFGFIGYKTEEQAAEAQKYFNGTFIDTSKLQVDFAKAIGDDKIPRAWSKYTKGTSAYSNTFGAKEEQERLEKENELKLKQKQEQEDELNEKKKQFLTDLYGDENDPKLKEFLSVMKPRSGTKTWANDEAVPAELAKPAKKHVVFDEDDDDQFIQDLPNDQILQDEIANNPLISDLDYLKARMIENDVSDDDDAPEEVSSKKVATVSVAEPVAEPQPETLPAVSEPNLLPEVENDLVADTGRLFIRNLAYSCTTQELEELFSKYGPLAETHISIDKLTKLPKGYGFIQFLMPIDAVNAYSELAGTIFQGRILDISPAQEKIQEEIIDESTLSFKQKRALEKKKNAKNEFNWNSLFMNSDTVASAMAAKLGVKKSEILNPEADNMAVRLALAETNVIAETKQYFEEHGVSLDGFTDLKNRSNTILLVKNIPFNTHLVEIEQVFQKFGSLGRVLLPPSKTIAIVEFLAENEAKAAFKNLAYSKFKHLPLYLEWAPSSTFTSAFNKEEYQKQKMEKAVKIKENESLEPSEEESVSLFVKNLNFLTTEAGLKSVFEALDGFRSCRISTKPAKNGVKISMGFGFVEFGSKEQAKEALKAMQGFVLDGHALVLKFSTGYATSQKQSKTRPKGEANNPEACLSSKIIVRNVPFEATKKELRQLFSPFGQVKSVRIPKKMDGQHRGFGFIEFLTKQEARAAFEALQSTHFYGRHLVLEWAKEEESIDAARLKSKRQMLEVQAQEANKKLKQGDEDDEYY